MNDTTQTLVRSLLKIGGGYLVAKGIADKSDVEALGAGLLALVAVIWGVYHRRKIPPPAPPALLGLLLGLFVLSGCAYVTGTRQAPDGSVLRISSVRWLWQSEGVNFTLSDTNGVRVGLSLAKSNPDAAAIGAAAEGVARGLGKP